MMPQDPPPASRTAEALSAVLDVMRRLRDPQSGCPWDQAQTFNTIAPYTIEEAYEVADAIERADMNDLREELGDLLFQVVFHAQMGQEVGAFDFADVAVSLSTKMTSRHPHVFGTVASRSAEQQTQAWEALKAQERAAKKPNAGLLDDVPYAAPALMRAEKLTKRAARIGFDWPDPEAVFEKLEEELAELAQARAAGDAEAVAEEMGDLLFVMANLARKLGVDPETALRAANAKFCRRFAHMEATMQERGEAGAVLPLADLEALWQAAKSAERG